LRDDGGSSSGADRARRELRGGLKGFAVFLACLVLGVATIATVRTVADGVLDALHRDARVLLGGDVWIRNLYQPVTAAQRERLRAGGGFPSRSKCARWLARLTVTMRPWSS